MQVDGAEGEAQPKKKKVVKKKEVPFVWGSTGLDAAMINQFREFEAEMHAADKLVMDTEVCSPAVHLHAQLLTSYTGT